MLHIVYRDNIGIVSEQVDDYGISFGDRFAYFDVGDKSRKIPVDNIIEINIININE